MAILDCGVVSKKHKNLPIVNSGSNTTRLRTASVSIKISNKIVMCGCRNRPEWAFGCRAGFSRISIYYPVSRSQDFAGPEPVLGG